MGAYDLIHCCDRCTHSADDFCDDYIDCLTRGPICHDDPECSARRKQTAKRILFGGGTMVKVGLSSCSVERGAREVINALLSEFRHSDLKGTDMGISGCLGYCSQEPVVIVSRTGEPSIVYGRVTADRVERLVGEHILGGDVIEEWVLGTLEDYGGDFFPAWRVHDDLPNLWKDVNFFAFQEKRLSRDCGIVSPESLEEYIVRGGYRALSRVVRGIRDSGSSGRAEILEGIIESGLQGRSGDGYLAGLKWGITAYSKGEEKYAICNGYEWNPNSFKDRMLMESDPYRIVESLTILGILVGAREGYILLNPTYTLAEERLEMAIGGAKVHHLLGDGILGSDMDFHIRVVKGPGAYICGEETALISYLEGWSGEAKVKPPYPSEEGLWGKPTAISNVETLANIPDIIVRGPGWFGEVGVGGNRGTRLFSISGGGVEGVVEVPLGISLGKILDGMGLPRNGIGAASLGGYIGGILPKGKFDLPLDYDSLRGIQSIGDGAIVLYGEDFCPVNWAAECAEFGLREACGKCVPGREGSYHLNDILQKIVRGKGRKADIEVAVELATHMRSASLCGLGRLIPSAILNTIEFFPEEYDLHTQYRGRLCRAGVCKMGNRGGGGSREEVSR
ncbi:MAG: NADH-ubiquinone oxidoreductase-F iron-sulfur binding region domain-containing protein [bacterium]